MVDTKVVIFRKVNNKVRYYSLALTKTLFGGYILIKENGSIKNSRPTRIANEYFNEKTEAINAFKIRLQERYKRGYVLNYKELTHG
jgi:predicted DNA-binding WGR domain protein